MAKSSIHMQPMRSMTAEQANENERRWTKEQYERKNADTDNHYDWTRRDLNFEVTLDKDGRPAIRPLRSDIPLNERLQKRLDQLGFKAYKKDARNDPYCCIDCVLGGDQDKMRELAFGNQDVAFDLSRDNSHVKREQLIEQWAMDAYEHAVEEWGADNIIGMEVHLDESNPHAHLLVVPTAMRKQRGRVKAGTERKEKLAVSFSGKVGDNQIQRAEFASRIHTEFAEKVGNKYGLERGDVIMELPEEERDARVHKNKRQLEAERRSKEREKKAMEKAEETEQRISSLESKVESLEETKKAGEKECEQIQIKTEELEEKKNQLEILTQNQKYYLNNTITPLVKDREEQLQEAGASLIDKGKSAIRGFLGMEQSQSQKDRERIVRSDQEVIELNKRVQDADQRAEAKYLPIVADLSTNLKEVRAENAELKGKLSKQSDYDECKRKAKRVDRLEAQVDDLSGRNSMMEAAVDAATTHGLPTDTIRKLASGKQFEYCGELRYENHSFLGRWLLRLQKVGENIALKCHMGWYREQHDRPSTLYYPIDKACQFIKRHWNEWMEHYNKRENKSHEQTLRQSGGFKM